MWQGCGEPLQAKGQMQLAAAEAQTAKSAAERRIVLLEAQLSELRRQAED